MTIDVAARQPAPRPDNQDPALFGQTPSQTVGPFFHYGLPWKGGADLYGQSDLGARAELFPEAHYVLNLPAPRGTPEGAEIHIAGRILDADGQPVVDAMVELWQADAQGRYGLDRDPAFVGFGRSSTDEDGVWRFRTVRPGRIDADQAPHVALSIFGRGLLKRLATRLYFADGEGNDRDPVLAVVPSDRRETLIATRWGNDWWLDIVLSGVGETVFFDL